MDQHDEIVTGIGRTGVVGVIKGKSDSSGRIIGLRADMDALPIPEQTGLDYASKTPGKMHACGHDAHIAMLLGAAKVLTAVKDDLAGSVMLIFQPAEEGAPLGEEGGAELMLKEGIWADRTPEAVFGIHVGISNDGAALSTSPGPTMAASDRFELTVRGSQTHGAMPWKGVDPIVVAAQVGFDIVREFVLFDHGAVGVVATSAAAADHHHLELVSIYIRHEELGD